MSCRPGCVRGGLTEHANPAARLVLHDSGSDEGFELYMPVAVMKYAK
jgi:hypothetical protein